MPFLNKLSTRPQLRFGLSIAMLWLLLGLPGGGGRFKRLRYS